MTERQTARSVSPSSPRDNYSDDGTVNGLHIDTSTSCSSSLSSPASGAAELDPIRYLDDDDGVNGYPVESEDPPEESTTSIEQGHSSRYLEARDSPSVPMLGDFTVVVGNPQKVLEGSSSFVTYLVESKRPGLATERVRRRFSDFVKLYQQLLIEHPACAIPPLPDHSKLEYISGDRFGTDFTTKRGVSLERFMFRLTQHPRLSQTRTLAAFLAPRDMLAAKRTKGLNSEPSFVETLSDTLLNAFTKVKNQSKEMLDAKELTDSFEQNVVSIEKAFSRMSRHQAELANDLKDICKQAAQLAKLEPDLHLEFEALSTTSKAVSGALHSLHLDMDAHFASALRDMAHYVHAVKQLLKDREQRQIDYESLKEYLSRTESDLHSLKTGGAAQGATSTSSFLRTKVNDLRGVDKEQTRQYRIGRLTERVEVLKKETSDAKELSDSFEEVAKREVSIFEATEELEIRSCLGGIADSNIAFYRGVLTQCQQVLDELDAREGETH